MIQDTGLLIKKEMNKNWVLTKFVTDKVESRRNKNDITHDIRDMLKKRIYSFVR